MELQLRYVTHKASYMRVKCDIRHVAQEAFWNLAATLRPNSTQIGGPMSAKVGQIPGNLLAGFIHLWSEFEQCWADVGKKVWCRCRHTLGRVRPRI